MNDALDDVRCEEWQAAKRAVRGAMPRRDRPGRPARTRRRRPRPGRLKNAADAIKGSRFALVKNPEDLTDAQRAKLESLKRKAGSRLFRAWELKEGLRSVFRAGTAEEAERLLEARMHDAAYCKIKPVVAVEKKVRRRRADIVATVELGIGNRRVEAINNKIKVAVKVGYVFRNTDNLIGLLMLRCSDCKPSLPGRPGKTAEKKAA